MTLAVIDFIRANKHFGKAINLKLYKSLEMQAISCFIALCFVSGSLAQKPWDPVPRNEGWWLDRHQQFLNSTASLGSQIKIIFLGSSIVENWNNEGRPVWEQNYAGLGAINYVDTVVTKLHEKLPNANILLVATFPRADQSNVRLTLERIRDINEKLRVLVSGDSQRRSHFIDLFWFLAPPSMDGIIQDMYVADKLHLTQRGYEMWAREMNSTFQSLIQ